MPNVPGVPALSSYSAGAVVLLVSDLVATLLGTTPQWGIYLDGLPAIVADSTVSFEFKQDWSVSDYPVEAGGFQSYDKVQLPFDVRVRMSAGGSEANRQAFLDSVADAANTLNLYDVVTPEEVYSSCCITHWDYRRTSRNGVGLVQADIWLVEVRVTSTATFTSTQQPQGQDPQGQGNVVPQSVPQMFQSDFSAFN